MHRTMILKELDAFVAADKFGAAGRKAEEQIAFYLKRGFARDPEIHVFNGIRLEHEGDAAQIDHLVLHPHGFVIVESKSVSDAVQIDARGHWTRWFDNRPKGMPSPINQARLQAEFLRQVLADRLEPAAGRRGVLAPGIEERHYDVLVAISDQGRISCKGALDPAVIKADEVIDMVRTLVESRRPRRLLARTLGELGLYEMDRIADFLIENHRPLGGAAAEPAAPEPPPPPPPPPPPKRERREPTLARRTTAPAPEPAPEPAPAPAPAPASAAGAPHACGKCGSADVEIRYGRFGYYFKCRACDGNTAIKAACPACGKAARLRKQGPQFSTDCEACGTLRPFFTNPAEDAAAP